MKKARQTVNLIPMAGAGQRFADAGYTLPKPLIPVDGVPMAVRAAAALPAANRWIFICRHEHLRDHHLDRVLQQHYPGAVVLSVDRLTEGQAATCLLAADHLHDEDALTIGACDNGMHHDAQRLEALWTSGADAVIWTFRGHPAVLRRPAAYGWVSVDGDGWATGVSCKVPLSDDPLNDHAVVGAFSFRRAGDFKAAAARTIALNRRVNGEFYLDVVADQAIRDGMRVGVLEVASYVCWGTPEDLERYRADG
jgi:dTDP-glucose pyrophosphorylase